MKQSTAKDSCFFETNINIIYWRKKWQKQKKQKRMYHLGQRAERSNPLA